ncbi:molybdopterin-dependent oxidoreductase [Candidatus Flexifilum breve]|uniref:molybdopterin-dependent oxidoreductase n=1 Tax=Candidatus Flexifilum breve TaxID=3140694 RepID=UPI0031CC5970
MQLAREIALTKPCFITQGWGPQRQANGEQTSRAIPMLAILTGNIGIHGGGTGARDRVTALAWRASRPCKTRFRPTSPCSTGRMPFCTAGK